MVQDFEGYFEEIMEDSDIKDIVDIPDEIIKKIVDKYEYQFNDFINESAYEFMNDNKSFILSDLRKALKEGK